MLRWRFPLWPVLLAALCACAGGSVAERGPSRDYSVLTAEEISSVSGVTTLYDVIRLRRPRWFTRPKPTAFRMEGQVDIVVYMDNIRFGGPESLRQMHPASVRLVQYLSPAQAESRFGQGHLNGAILVLTLP